jgi:shikimate kinase
MKHNIFLIGMMAVGKSTVGRHLATKLGLDFFDTDRIIEERAGTDIVWIFDVEGEKGFRDREQKVVDEFSRREGIVLATGGGVILRPINRQHLAARGTVVYMSASLDRLVERTRSEERRPLLVGGNTEGKLRKLLQERKELYEKTADIEVVAGKATAKSLANEIVGKLEMMT